MNSSKLGIEKFDGSDLSFLKIHIKYYLYLKDLHELLTAVNLKSMTEKWKLKDRQALWLIWLTLSRNFAFNIVKDKTASDLLKALSIMYEKP